MNEYTKAEIPPPTNSLDEGEKRIIRGANGEILKVGDKVLTRTGTEYELDKRGSLVRTNKKLNKKERNKLGVYSRRRNERDNRR